MIGIIIPVSHRARLHDAPLDLRRRLRTEAERVVVQRGQCLRQLEENLAAVLLGANALATCDAAR